MFKLSYKNFDLNLAFDMVYKIHFVLLYIRYIDSFRGYQNEKLRIPNLLVQRDQRPILTKLVIILRFLKIFVEICL